VIKRYSKSLLELYELDDRSESTTEAFDESFCRTLLHDTISVDHIYQRITRTDSKRLYYLLDKDSTYNVVRIMMNRRHLEGRTMAQTTDRRLALVPKNTRVGDEVAILFGADVPFVLRRKADRAAHALIGE
jgi:hypothetical protein